MAFILTTVYPHHRDDLCSPVGPDHSVKVINLSDSEAAHSTMKKKKTLGEAAS